MNDALEHPAVRRMRDVLAGPSWAQILKNLPGYRPVSDPGGLLNAAQIVPRGAPIRGARAGSTGAALTR